jgi:hypothetical protein
MVSLRVDDQNLLSRVTPCFGRHVKLLVPVAFAVVSIHFQEGLTSGPVVKIIAKSLSQHGEKHVLPTPLSGIRVEDLYHNLIHCLCLSPNYLLFSCAVKNRTTE